MPKGMPLVSRNARLCDVRGGSRNYWAILLVSRKLDEAVRSAEIFTKEETWAHLRTEGLNIEWSWMQVKKRMFRDVESLRVLGIRIGHGL